jgi:SAM-dependent methyltransferase
MYSLAWFNTFASTVAADVLEAELAAIEAMAPPAEYPAALDIGCGVGRASAGLSLRGYRVTGIDVNADALATARTRAPGVQFVELDQRRVGDLVGPFDLALVLWHSIGHASPADDEQTIRAIASVLRPGGILLLDMFHPDWLATHGRIDYHDERGATINRHVRGGRCINRIEYVGGGVDHIEFNVYTPSEMTRLAAAAGFEVAAPIAWWRPELAASEEHARYQLKCCKGN